MCLLLKMLMSYALEKQVRRVLMERSWCHLGSWLLCLECPSTCCWQRCECCFPKPPIHPHRHLAAGVTTTHCPAPPAPPASASSPISLRGQTKQELSWHDSAWAPFTLGRVVSDWLPTDTRWTESVQRFEPRVAAVLPHINCLLTCCCQVFPYWLLWSNMHI